MNVPVDWAIPAKPPIPKFAQLGLEPPVVVHDLPAGGKRIVQRARGYRHTFVHGTEVARDGEDTGARPGRLLRGFQAGPGRARPNCEPARAG
jgi:N-acyl-D-aspartate/D-glutamate deacylase